VQNFVKDVITRLARNQVEFVIVGGISAVLNGVPLVTVDLDICYRRTQANISRLIAALAELQPRPRGLPPDLPFIFDERTLLLGSNFTFFVGDEELDLLGEMSAIGGYEQIIGQSEEMEVAGFRVKVLSLAQLITTKEAAGRPKDIAVLPLMNATLDTLRRRTNPSHEPDARP
jgi:predicted nucleotidyltransferase